MEGHSWCMPPPVGWLSGPCLTAHDQRKEKGKHVGKGNSPYMSSGEGDALNHELIFCSSMDADNPEAEVTSLTALGTTSNAAIAPYTPFLLQENSEAAIASLAALGIDLTKVSKLGGHSVPRSHSSPVSVWLWERRWATVNIALCVCVQTFTTCIL
eukprot:scaffold109490_cov19-Tisochrysis_lutea.AAC.1